MKRYRFGLDKVLSLRERIEELRQKEFSALQLRVMEQEKILDGLNEEHVKQAADLTEKKEFSTSDLSLYSGFLSRLKRQIESGAKLLDERLGESDSKRVELVEASRDKKTLENIKSKQYKNHLKEVDLQETKELDEHSISRYANKKGFR